MELKPIKHIVVNYNFTDGEEVTNKENIYVWNADFNSEDPDLMIGMFVQHQVLSK